MKMRKIFRFSLLLLMSVSTDAQSNRGNLLSQGKDASQNSVRVGSGGNYASKAVDGYTSGNWGDGTCTHTAGSTNNWWQVDLGKTATVKFVKIYNRVDCCQSRIGGAKVYVGDVYCGEVTYATGRSVYTLDCSGIFGSTVKVVQNQQILTLCEVQVYGYFRNKGVLLKNIAGGHVATQNTVGHGGKPYRAIDGRTSGGWGDGTCTHSSGSSGNWWQVDLVDSYVIDSVVVHNRKDCCQNRINGARVYVDGVLCGVISYVTGKNVYPISCKRTGSVVKIKQNSNILTLCEVEILAPATSVRDVQEERGELLSLNKPTSSNSVSHNGVPARAVDGKTSGQWGDRSCTHSSGSSNNWWKVDLGGAAEVNIVKIYNRQDCCEDRISAAKVYVGGEFCDEVTYTAGQPVYVLDCGGIVGDSVKVVQNHNILTLCEVEVYGEQECDCSFNGISNDYESTAVAYSLTEASVRAFRPETVGKQHIDNEDGTIQQSSTFGVSKEVTETASFTHTGGVSVTAGVEFETGIPLVASGTVSLEVSVSYEFSAGTERSVARTITAEYNCEAPPGKTVTCEALLFKYRMSVPYTQTWTHKRLPGCTCQTSGVFEEVTASEMRLTIDED